MIPFTQYTHPARIMLILACLMASEATGNLRESRQPAATRVPSSPLLVADREALGTAQPRGLFGPSQRPPSVPAPREPPREPQERPPGTEIPDFFEPRPQPTPPGTPIPDFFEPEDGAQRQPPGTQIPDFFEPPRGDLRPNVVPPLRGAPSLGSPPPGEPGIVPPPNLGAPSLGSPPSAPTNGGGRPSIPGAPSLGSPP